MTTENEDAKARTSDYARQIVAVVEADVEGDAEYLVTEMLKEYGAKAYKQGRMHLAAEQIKFLSTVR